MATQHIATLLGATCGMRLATLLRHVGCCRLKFEHFQTGANNTQHFATARNTAANRTQHVALNNVAICCVGMLRSFGRGFRVHDSCKRLKINSDLMLVDFDWLRGKHLRSIRAL